MREFEADLEDAFRAPMRRPPGPDVAALVEARLKQRDRLRVAAVLGGTFAGASILAAALSAVRAMEALRPLVQETGAEAARALPEILGDPATLILLGAALLAAAMARVAVRDLR
jgi:hypothetical protein